MLLTIIFVSLSLQSFTASSENSLENLKTAQTKLRGEIKEMIKNPTCSQKSDCAVLELGNDGLCGNPTDFWAYSKKTVDSAKLDKLRQMERTLAHKIQQSTKKQGDMMMGACGFKTRIADCVEGLCKL